MPPLPPGGGATKSLRQGGLPCERPPCERAHRIRLEPRLAPYLVPRRPFVPIAGPPRDPSTSVEPTCTPALTGRVAFTCADPPVPIDAPERGGQARQDRPQPRKGWRADRLGPLAAVSHWG